MFDIFAVRKVSYLLNKFGDISNKLMNLEKCYDMNNMKKNL